MIIIVYRPTVRMDNVFQDYVNAVFKVSNLDRNQIIRLMLATAPHTSLYQSKLKQLVKIGSDVPLPYWTIHDESIWKTQEWVGKNRVESEDVLEVVNVGVKPKLFIGNGVRK